jgi:folate-binding protein YgfZ
MGLLRLTGPDRQTWLQGMITNEVQKLAPGKGCYAGHLNAQGKLVAQMIVLAAEDAVWLLVERSAIGNLAAAFDRLIIMEDVQLQDVSEEYDLIHIVGPDASDVLRSLTSELPALDQIYDHRLIGGHRILRSDLGYGLIVNRNGSGTIASDAVSAGATPIDETTWNILRIEAGLPVYGIDIDETTVLPELGDRGISYDKGCYIGQEVVAKIKYIGHVNRRFVGFLCDGNVAPEPRSPVRVAGKEVGYVTSSVVSPGVGKSIALGFVTRAASAPGTGVELIGKETAIAATVSQLPFTILRAD